MISNMIIEKNTKDTERNYRKNKKIMKQGLVENIDYI